MGFTKFTRFETDYVMIINIFNLYATEFRTTHYRLRSSGYWFVSFIVWSVATGIAAMVTPGGNFMCSFVIPYDRQAIIIIK